MKSYFMIFVLLVWSASLYSQNYPPLYHENFESPGFDDSVSYITTPIPTSSWGINTRLFTGSNSQYSDSCQVQAGNTIYMESPVFSTEGLWYTEIRFWQICKIDTNDIATVDISGNGGLTWNSLSSYYYAGAGTYANKFTDASRGSLWQPGNPSAIPDNSWWREERFVIPSALSNATTAKIRFSLKDGGPAGSGGEAGWFIDNIRLWATFEASPPVIGLNVKNPVGEKYKPGPYPVKARVYDQSYVETVSLVWSINNGPWDSCAMIYYTYDSLKAYLPLANDGDTIKYYVSAIDASSAHNYGRNPTQSNKQINYVQHLHIPYYDNFNANLHPWSALLGSTNAQTIWQYGKPNYGVTNSAHSTPNCWDINLLGPYQNDANCILQSPPIFVDNYEKIFISFWHNYKTLLGGDGYRLLYSKDSINWIRVGDINDSLGTNWYNSNLPSVPSPGWSGNSGGWKKASYALDDLANYSGNIFLRFVFTSDNQGITEGLSVDDIAITTLPSQEASMTHIVAPSSACGLGEEEVKVNIFNAGNDSIKGNLSVSYLLENEIIINEIITDTIAPATDYIHTFSTKINLSPENADTTFHLKAWIVLAGDSIRSNDTTSSSIFSRRRPPVPIVNNMTVTYGYPITFSATSNYPVTWFNEPFGGNPMDTGLIVVSPSVYDTLTYYAEALAPNACPSLRSQLTITPQNFPATDLFLEQIINPQSDWFLTNYNVITIRLINIGTSALDAFDVSYSFNSEAIVTHSFTDTIAPQDTLVLMLPDIFDLSTFGSYSFKIWVNAQNDMGPFNDTLSKVVISSPFTPCISKSVTSFGSDIGNLKISNIDNGVAFPVTYNSAAIKGYTNYSLSIPAIQLRRVIQYPVSITPIFQTVIAPVKVKIFIDWNANGQFEEASETAFSGSSTGGLPITGFLEVPPDADLGIIQFRVVSYIGNLDDIHPCGQYQEGETEDYKANIIEAFSNDAQILDILRPNPGYLCGNPVETRIKIRNNGGQAITSLTIPATIDGILVKTFTWTGSILPTQVKLLSFTFDSLPESHHDLCFSLHLAGDTLTANNDTCRLITGYKLTGFPFYDSFNSLNPRFFTMSLNTGLSWKNFSPLNGFFPLAGAHSPPDIWSTNNNSGLNQTDTKCILSSPAFDFSNTSGAMMSFWMNFKTHPCNGMIMEYSVDTGATWSVLGMYNDVSATNWYNSTCPTGAANYSWGEINTNGWVKSTFKLYVWNLNKITIFRFYYESDGSSPTEGFALDDFKLSITMPDDAGATNITAPVGVLMSETFKAITCTIKNFGTDTLNTIPLAYQVDNGPIVTDTCPVSLLPPGGSTSFTFSTPFEVPLNPFSLKIFSLLPGDVTHENDTTIKSFQVIPFCQTILPGIDTASLNPAMSLNGTLDICPGTAVTLKAKSLYPQNNTLYHQSDSTSLFFWKYGDGSTDTGPISTHLFTTPGTYNVVLRVKDTHNCLFGYSNVIAVRISPDSIASVHALPILCPGKAVTISIGTDDTCSIVFSSTNYNMAGMLHDSIRMFLPDAGLSGGGCVFHTINIHDTPPGATINNISDIKEIKINIEHSYVGDVEISLTCPNGQTSVLKSYIQSGNSFLGQPYGGVDHTLYDCSSPPSCIFDSTQNPAGIGWTYIFTNNTLNSVLNYNNQNPIDSGYYKPEDKFLPLIGCPVNGNWTFTACDYWGHDNGYLFWWELGLQPELCPPVESMHVGIDTVIFTGPGITSFGKNQITVTQPNLGTYTYNVHIIDEFGCTYDTSLQLEVGAGLELDCGSDTAFLDPTNYTIQSEIMTGIPPFTYLWSTGDTTPSLTVQVVQTAIYYLSVTDASGCLGIDSVSIFIGLLPSESVIFNDDKEWSVYTLSDNGFPVYSTLHYRCQGDSLVNSQSYKIVKTSPDGNPVTWNSSFLAREVGPGKVYILLSGSPPSEGLLFDFSLKAGDSAYINPGPSGIGHWVKVISADTVFHSGAYRKRLLISNLNDVAGIVTDIWITGLGSFIDGALPSKNILSSISDTLLCVKQSDMLIYENPIYLSCHLENTSIPVLNESAVLIYPNPVTDVSGFMSKGLPFGPVVVEIYDIVGRMTGQIKANSLGEVRISSDHFLAGLYQYRIRFRTATYSGRFIVR